MADFHQQGIVTNLHNLYGAFDRQEYLAGLEEKLETYARHAKISLLLPCLFSELEQRQVLDNIVSEINKVRYLGSIVVALGGAPEEEKFREAGNYFRQLSRSDCEVRIVWIDGPRVQGVLQTIRQREISVGVQGKGQSVWTALGYILGRGESEVVALHDCDIVTYDRILLGRLIEPVANPNNDFEFCKGYYARISPSERTMKGRVTRLFVVPFVDAMIRIMRERRAFDNEKFFAYHRSFNYPLAGEFSFTTHLAKGIDIAYDWGLEVSTLSEVYHRVMPRKIAQVDLAANYEHKHQVLSVEDPARGLHRMVIDIAKFYLNYMRSHGYALNDGIVDMLLHTYYQNALNFIKTYSDDAELNGLHYDRYAEEMAVQHFRGFLWRAWEQSKGPTESTVIPSWNRVVYSVPDIYRQLIDAVEADNG
ncbi:MAG: glycosyl transferase [Thermodesulfobacteriota bacterium]